jgi:NADH-quinone oxidoreductase subunit A
VSAEEYAPALVFAALAIAFPIVVLLIARLLQPHNPSERKGATYECGEEPVGDATVQFSFHYYIYAILFVAFEVVILLLVLWSLTIRADGPEAVVSATMLMTAFLVCSTAAAFYVLRRVNELRGSL